LLDAGGAGGGVEAAGVDGDFEVLESVL